MVSLADTKELDEARKIEEMYHALFMKEKGGIALGNPLGIDASNAPEAYKKLGDPISGCYLINASSTNYIPWFEKVAKDSYNSSLTRLVGIGDTVGVMEASTLQEEIPSVYVPVRGNPLGPFKMDTITRKSVQIAKTKVGRGYKGIVESEENKQYLKEYFSGQTVEGVREMILDGIKQANV